MRLRRAPCCPAERDLPVQIAKLLIIPFVCLVERCWLGRVFTKPVILSVLTVVTGVAIVYAALLPPGARGLARAPCLTCLTGSKLGQVHCCTCSWCSGFSQSAPQPAEVSLASLGNSRCL